MRHKSKRDMKRKNEGTRVVTFVSQCVFAVCAICVCVCLSACAGKDLEKQPVETQVPEEENRLDSIPVPEEENGLDSIPVPEEENGLDSISVPEEKGVEDTSMFEEEDRTETVTVMIYMDASTLESGEEPFASYDMNQMLEAEPSEHVRVLIETGGTKYWTNEAISTQTTQRYEVKNQEFILIDDTKIQQDMTKADTLKEFILYGAKTAPADRYILILWGHGRGPRIGYGMDDFQNSGKAMSLEDMAAGIEQAIEDSGISFELIGFDACLMGNLETVYALRNCADYLALSEDYEPAYGWQYTTFLNTLSENPSIESTVLAQVIVDGFMEEAKRSGDRGIMAVVDTSYAEELTEAWHSLCEAQDSADSQLSMTEILNRIWTDERLLTPVPTSSDGYVSDDDLYSIQDYELTDMQAICEQASVPQAEDVLNLLQQSIICVDSFHMARTMCGLAVCPE